MKAMIHKELERMNGIFQKYGIETEGFPDPAPSSLTALLLRDKEIAFFLLPNVEAWSLGHVLSAAKLLSSRGGSFLLWEGPDRPSSLRTAADILLSPGSAGSSIPAPPDIPPDATMQRPFPQPPRASSRPPVPAGRRLSAPLLPVLRPGPAHSSHRPGPCR